jgi:hypothetical protein
MTKGAEDRGLLSRLPGTPRYWEDLTACIVERAGPHLRARRAQQPWWRPLGRFSSSLAAAAALAMALGAVFLMTGPPRRPLSGSALEADAFGLAPDHPVARSLLAATAPPPVEALLGLRAGEILR